MSVLGELAIRKAERALAAGDREQARILFARAAAQTQAQGRELHLRAQLGLSSACQALGQLQPAWEALAELGLPDDDRPLEEAVWERRRALRTLAAERAQAADDEQRAEALLTWARLEIAAEDPGAALQPLADSAELAFRRGELEGAAWAFAAAGEALLDLGRPRAARRKLEAARDAVGEQQGPLELRCLFWRGFAATDLALLDAGLDEPALVLLAEDDLDLELATDRAPDLERRRRRARDEAVEAVELAEQTRKPSARARAHRLLARAQLHLGQEHACRDQLRRASEVAAAAPAERLATELERALIDLRLTEPDRRRPLAAEQAALGCVGLGWPLRGCWGLLVASGLVDAPARQPLLGRAEQVLASLEGAADQRASRLRAAWAALR